MSRLSRILWYAVVGLFVIACIARPACEPRTSEGEDVVWSEPVCEAPVPVLARR